MRFKSFDVASTVLEEANKRFSPIWKPNNERVAIFQQYCDVVDDLIEEFDGESIDVEVDEIKMTICLRIECADITIKTKSHKYYELMQRTVSFGFEATDSDMIALKLVFPSVWEKAM